MTAPLLTFPAWRTKRKRREVLILAGAVLAGITLPILVVLGVLGVLVGSP